VAGRGAADLRPVVGGAKKASSLLRSLVSGMTAGSSRPATQHLPSSEYMDTPDVPLAYLPT
jgi:hypothetical protein